jgi:hypothetical protein
MAQTSRPLLKTFGSAGPVGGRSFSVRHDRPPPWPRGAPPLGFLELPLRAPELRLLDRWLDTWTGVGLILAGMGYGMNSIAPMSQNLRLSPSPSTRR